jgi:hypothetical protein
MENCDPARIFNGSLIYHGFEPVEEIISDEWYKQSSEGSINEIEEFLSHWQIHDRISIGHCQCKFCQKQGNFIEICDESLEVLYSLEIINSPADFLEIAEVHNEIFPDNPLAIEIVHQLLANGIAGIVRIKQDRESRYALRVWGYRQNVDKVTEVVEEIIENIYEKTNRPVPFNALVAELARSENILRDKIIKRALTTSPNITDVGNNSYIPRDLVDDLPNQELIDELLAKFADDLKELTVI